MNQTKIEWEEVTLKLVTPFRVSYGASSTRQAFLLKLQSGHETGEGEGTIPPYYGVDTGAMTACWAAARQQKTPENIGKIAAFCGSGPAPARCALDLACHDLLAKRAGKPMHAFLGLKQPRGGGEGIETSVTISLDEPGVMAEEAKRLGKYGILKMKLGSDDDRARVRAVRLARPDARIRVDANAAWTLAESIEHLKWLEQERIELIEQPMAREALEQMGEVQSKTSVPVMADESVQSMEDVVRLANAGVRGINLKLMKVGGLGAGVEILKYAKGRSMLIMLGCMIETSLGTTAMAHLSGEADFVDLDAPLLIANDPYVGMTFDEHGRIGVPSGSGIGAVRR